MLLTGSRVLIVEDEALIAMEMADAVTAADGVVAGPFTTAHAAMRYLRYGSVGGAILDCRLGDHDITPVAVFLAERRIPVVVYSGGGLSAELKAACPGLAVISKPGGTERVIDALAALIDLGVDGRLNEALRR